jgi:hypothetical protein
VLCEQARLGATRLEELGQRAVERPPTGPGRVDVDRLASEVVPEGRDARLDLVQQAALEELRDPGVFLENGEHVELEPHAHRGRRLERGSCRTRNPLGTQPNDVADRVRNRHGRARLELQSAAPGNQEPALLQGCCELLDEEGNTLRPVVERRPKHHSRFRFEDSSRQ